MEEFPIKLKELLTENRDRLNEWFYNASDAQLSQSISVMNSNSVMSRYPKELLKEYVKFARSLLQGQLPSPPENDPSETAKFLSPYMFSKSCYILRDTLSRVIRINFKVFFKMCALLMAVQRPEQVSSKLCSKQIGRKDRVVSVLFNVITWKTSAICRFSIETIKKHMFKPAKFKTKAQVKKLKLKSIREMIIKGKINLEQRALWKWRVQAVEKRSLRRSIRADFSLIGSVFSSANMKYALVLKTNFGRFKETSSMKWSSRTSRGKFRKNFEKKLNKGLEPIKRKTIEIYFDALDMLIKWVNAKFYVQDVIKPKLRNFEYILKIRLADVLIRLNNSQFYEPQNTKVKTINNHKSGPDIVSTINEKEKIGSRLFFRFYTRFLNNLLKIKLKQWRKYIQLKELSFEEEVFDLSSFKLTIYELQKLKTLMKSLDMISKKKKNMNKHIISIWLQESNKRHLFLSKLQTICYKLQTKQRLYKSIFTALKTLPKKYKSKYYN